MLCMIYYVLTLQLLTKIKIHLKFVYSTISNPVFHKNVNRIDAAFYSGSFTSIGIIKS